MKMWGNIIGAVKGRAGEKWHEAEKIDSTKIPFVDEKSIKFATDYLAKSKYLDSLVELATTSAWSSTRFASSASSSG